MTVKKMTKLLKTITMFTLIITLIPSLQSKAGNSNTVEHTKKISMENMVYLKEDQYSLAKYLNNSEIYSTVEECINDILHSSKKTIVIEKSDKLNKKQLETVLAVLDAKYFPYYELEVGEEVGEKDYALVINTNKARKTYQKNKNIQNKIDNILFSQLKINSNTTEYEAVYKINDWLYNNVKYDYSFKNTTAMDLLSTGKALCCAYTDTFKILCNRIGIECYCVASDAMSHAWNTVIIDNKEYHIDTTWNGCGYYDSWFLISEAEMLKDHYKPNWKDTKRVKIPKYYKINYVLNGGENNDKNITYTLKNSSNKLYKPTKSKYEFKGWYTDTQCKNAITNTSQITTQESSNITVYAKWKKIEKPVMKNVKVKNSKKYIRISWKASQENKTKYRIKAKSLNNQRFNITLSNNSVRINKPKSGEMEYSISITPYIIDSTSKRVYGKPFTLENRR